MCSRWNVVSCIVGPLTAVVPLLRSGGPLGPPSDGLKAVAYTKSGVAEVQLPDAPGKDETVRVCGTCHEVERVAAVRLTREGWQQTIAKMVDLGAKGSDEELSKVLEYLAEH